MGNYSLSSRAQYDLVGVYKYGLKLFGSKQAQKYLHELEQILEELAERPELAKDASSLAHNLKHYKYRSHVVFYQFDSDRDIYVVRILGKRMDFIAHI